MVPDNHRSGLPQAKGMGGSAVNFGGEQGQFGGGVPVEMPLIFCTIEKSGASLVWDLCPEHTLYLFRMVPDNHRSGLPQAEGMVGSDVKYGGEQGQFGGGIPVECH